MNDGHTVVAVDGLKIEPLGFDAERAGAMTWKRLFENLDDRVMAGFGGVAEYGITVRWNKNYLKLVRLLLERRIDQVRACRRRPLRRRRHLSIDDAWAMGFDHIALCMGAGEPTVLDIPNGLARGVRQASDFLMALQLTGAAKSSSIANLQLRLPVVVIGGGLTAIDTATESLAYYVRQVEKFALRFSAPWWPNRARNRGACRWTPEEEPRSPTSSWLHAAAIQAERRTASAAGRLPRLAGAAARSLGRRHRRLSPPPGGQPVLHAEPRGSRQGDGGRVRFAEGLTPRRRSRPIGSATPPHCG